MRYLIGIDIGGTKISVTLAAAAGKILSKQVLVTQKGRRARLSIRDIQTTIDHFLRRRKLSVHRLKGIGIAVPGPVDPRSEKIERSPNLPGWKGLPVRSILKKQFSCPVFVENDANAAALGEKYFGKGKRKQNFIYVTVSTGIGSGIITNGKLVRGSGGAAGEFGHMTVSIGGEQCACGKRGCLEAYASGTAMAKFAARAVRNGNPTKILDYCDGVRGITGKAVSLAARDGCRIAVGIRRRGGDYLGVGLANLINLLNPELIILGGGAVEIPHPLWPAMRLAVKREAWQYSRRHCIIMRTSLGNKVGDLGAIAVVLDRMSR